MRGKVQVMRALATHMQKIALPFITPRTLAGKSSPIIVHTTVPLEDWTMSMKTAMRPRMRKAAHDGGAVPAFMCGAMASWKVAAMLSRHTPAPVTSAMRI